MAALQYQAGSTMMTVMIRPYAEDNEQIHGLACMHTWILARLLLRRCGIRLIHCFGEAFAACRAMPVIISAAGRRQTT